MHSAEWTPIEIEIIPDEADVNEEEIKDVINVEHEVNRSGNNGSGQWNNVVYSSQVKNSILCYCNQISSESITTQFFFGRSHHDEMEI